MDIDISVDRYGSNLLNIPVDIEVIIGTTRLTIDKILGLTEGSIVSLKKTVGEPAEVSVNGKVLAHGNVIIIGDDSSQLGVIITKIL
ncbi:MAG: FliM/FliN family flagellar motor switch protein [Beijerinckiaceae bacterium]|nr:FliM/FliN family flagellar motor switch protein [Beijerinckiaceae bacterium]